MPEKHGRGGVVSAVIVAGVSTMFYSLATILVYSLGHDSGARTADSRTWPGGSPVAEDEDANMSTGSDLGFAEDAFVKAPSLNAGHILFWQCVIEGLFMSSVVGVPTLLAYVARKAEDKRAEETELLSQRDSDDSNQRVSMDTFTSNELRGIVVGDWADVDDSISFDSDGEPKRSRRVVFNYHIDYAPPAPPAADQDNLRSCLKRATRPAVVGAMRADVVAVLAAVAVVTRQVVSERERTPMPIPLPPRRAALLCVGYGVLKLLATLANYVALTSDLGLCNTAVLMASAPLFATVIRRFLVSLSYSRELTLKHAPGALLAAAAVATVLGTVRSSELVPVAVAVLVVGGFCSAAALQIHAVIRPQVHPYFIAVSFAVVGTAVCGLYIMLNDCEGPSVQQWGYTMSLCVCCLIADTTAASEAAEAQHIPSGFARTVGLALALGLQTVVLDSPPTIESSVAVVFAFSSGILLEIARMAANPLPYFPLAYDDCDAPPSTPPTPPTPQPSTEPPLPSLSTLPLPSRSQRTRRSHRTSVESALEV
ncbi:hypothetical protein DIPPA_12124 [Diplonema papillatum]|nr:hypothetical protein DIPPA_12124 [Diplonema papillatum]